MRTSALWNNKINTESQICHIICVTYLGATGVKISRFTGSFQIVFSFIIDTIPTLVT